MATRIDLPNDNDVTPLTRQQLHNAMKHYAAERVLYRPANKNLRLRLFLPYQRGGNRNLLKRVLGCIPQWGPDKMWLVSRSHFEPAKRLLKPGDIVILESLNKGQCDLRCQRATGTECECACFGRHHGGLKFLFATQTLVSETTVIVSESVQRHIFIVTDTGLQLTA